MYPRLPLVVFAWGLLVLFLLYSRRNAPLRSRHCGFSWAAPPCSGGRPTQAETEISLVAREFRRAPPEPKTVAEKFISRAIVLIIWLAWMLGYLRGEILLLGKRDYDLVSAWKAEIVWAVFWVLLMVVSVGFGRYVERRLARLRKSLMTEPPAEEEGLARRALRTIGFTLLSYPRLCSSALRGWITTPQRPARH